MAKVDPDAALLKRVEDALETNQLGVARLATMLEVPLITLRRFRKSGRALESTRHRISNGLRQMENSDSRRALRQSKSTGESDALRVEVIAALELLLDAARSAAAQTGGGSR